MKGGGDGGFCEMRQVASILIYSNVYLIRPLEKQEGRSE